MNKKTKIIVCSSILVVALAVCIFLILQNSDEKPEVIAPAINLEQYEKVKKGMSYEEVKTLFGKDGELSSEAGEKGTSTHVATYVWKGEQENTVVVVMFQDNKMTTKTQVGLT